MDRQQKSNNIEDIKPIKPLQKFSSIEKDEYLPPLQKKLNLRPLLRTIQRKAVLVISITSVITVSCGMWFAKKAPVYEGSFQILVEPITNEARNSDPSALSRLNQVIAGKDFFSVDYPTQIAILQSNKLLLEIIKQVQKKYATFNYFQLKTGLTVERVGASLGDNKTKIIQVTYKDEDPRLAQFVLEKTAAKYLSYSLNERINRIDEGVKFIDNQVPNWQKQVNKLQSELEILQRQYHVVDPKLNGEELLKQMRDVTEQTVMSERQLQELITLYNNIQKQLKLTPEEAIAVAALSQDPSYQELLKKLKELESQIALEATRFTFNSPGIESLKAKQQNLNLLLRKELERVVGKEILRTSTKFQGLGLQSSINLDLIKQLVETTNQIKVIQVRNQALIQNKKSFEQAAQLFPAIARRYTTIQQQLEITTQTLNQLLTQREKLRVESAQDQLPWQLVSPPQIITDTVGIPIPDKSDFNKKLAVVLILSLTVGILAAVFLEKYHDIFYTAETFKDTVEFPILGEIPLDKTVQNLDHSTMITENNINDNQSDLLFLKAFDSLYANLRFILPDKKIRSLAVCSAGRLDGKSTIALYLAQTAASVGQRVLLVDADFRESHLHNILNLPNIKGLSDLLSVQMDANDVIRRSPLMENLFILTAGQTQPNSHKVLASQQMQDLMTKFQESYDLVIYDTTNLYEATDANFIAAHTDGLLMVVAIGKSKYSQVQEVIHQLNNFGLSIIGGVANLVPMNLKSISNNNSNS